MGAAYTFTNNPPRTVIMTDAEIAELPVFAQEIIKHQREIEAFCSQAVVPMREAQNMLDRRTTLSRGAHKLWTSADDNPGPPPRRFP